MVSNQMKSIHGCRLQNQDAWKQCPLVATRREKYRYNTSFRLVTVTLKFQIPMTRMNTSNNAALNASSMYTNRRYHMLMLARSS
jgi:hypothetical protein